MMWLEWLWTFKGLLLGFHDVARIVVDMQRLINRFS